MPSHITHWLFAEDVMGTPLENSERAALALGAQGPDLFFHNQRRHPTGIFFGTRLHRKGYGAFTAALAANAREIGREASYFAKGFATHATLDRHLHPYINYFAGWNEPKQPETRALRYMHIFFERVLDVALWRRLQGGSITDVSFYEVANCGENCPPWFRELFERTLGQFYPKAGSDEELGQRIENTYLDSIGVYRFSSKTDVELLSSQGRPPRGDESEIPPKWLAMLHPHWFPSSIDVLNEKKRSWRHPCEQGSTHNESVLELYDGAKTKGTEICAALDQVLSEGANYERLEGLVGNHNLNDGLDIAKPCPRVHMDPLPLAETLTKRYYELKDRFAV
jgi:hypothetical protein